MNGSALRVIRSWISLPKADASRVLVTIAAVSIALTTAAGTSQRDARFDLESISFLPRPANALSSLAQRRLPRPCGAIC